MARIASRVDVRSTAYADNRAAMLDALAEIDALTAQVVRGGGSGDPAKDARSVAKLRGRGKLLPRERIELLLDRDSPFLELSPLAGWGTDDPLGGGMVTGIGVVDGRRVRDQRQRPDGQGRRPGPDQRGQGPARDGDRAGSTGCRSCRLTESGGADLPKQAEIFVPGGASFKNLTRLLGRGHPDHLAGVRLSTAGGAYVPGMSDYVVHAEGRGAKVFLGGPPLVKMAIDEDADEESLGGAEMHARVSGLADYLAADEPDAMRIGREIVAPPQLAQARARPLGAAPRAPAYDPEELLGIACADVRVPFEVREVIARIVDGCEFDEFKPLYGTHARHRLGAPPRLPGRHPRQQRHPVHRGGREGRAVHPALRAPSTCRSCSCRTSPASWSARATSRAASSRTARS